MVKLGILLWCFVVFVCLFFIVFYVFGLIRYFVVVFFVCLFFISFCVCG